MFIMEKERWVIMEVVDDVVETNVPTRVESIFKYGRHINMDSSLNNTVVRQYKIKNSDTVFVSENGTQDKFLRISPNVITRQMA